MKRVQSVSDQCDQMDKMYRNQNFSRVGVMAIFPTLVDFEQHLDAVLGRFPVLTPDTKPRDNGGEHLPINILNVGLADIVKGQPMTDNQMVAVLQPYIMMNKDKVDVHVCKPERR